MPILKPILYLDIVGTLVIERGGRLELAPQARAFAQGAQEHFELRFLTSLEEHSALGVAKALELEIPYIPFRRAIGKASAIDFTREFRWVDDDPTPTDLLRLSDEGCSSKLVVVNRRDGVNAVTLKKLVDSLTPRGEDEHAANA